MEATRFSTGLSFKYNLRALQRKQEKAPLLPARALFLYILSFCRRKGSRVSVLLGPAAAGGELRLLPPRLPRLQSGPGSGHSAREACIQPISEAASKISGFLSLPACLTLLLRAQGETRFAQAREMVVNCEPSAGRGRSPGAPSSVSELGGASNGCVCSQEGGEIHHRLSSFLQPTVSDGLLPSARLGCTRPAKSSPIKAAA